MNRYFSSLQKKYSWMDNWQPPLAHTSTLPPRCKQNTRVKIFGEKKVDLWNGNHGAGENRAKNYTDSNTRSLRFCTWILLEMMILLLLATIILTTRLRVLFRTLFLLVIFKVSISQFYPRVWNFKWANCYMSCINNCLKSPRLSSVDIISNCWRLYALLPNWKEFD